MLKRTRQFVERYRSDQSGTAGLEYALVAGALAITIIGSIQLAAVETNRPFENVSSTIGTVTPEKKAHPAGRAFC